MDRLIRRFIAGTVLMLLLLLWGRYISQGAGAVIKMDLRQLLQAGGQWLVEAIWNHAGPLSPDAGYRIGERFRIEGDEKIPDPDPSYRRYQAVKAFYQEHQYLAWYGNEESGQQTTDPQTAAASKSASDGREAAGEGDISGGQPGAFLIGSMNRPITGSTYVMEQLMDYDFLMKHFYSVHTSTTAGRELMNAKVLLEKDLTLEKDSSKPQILIYHTHSQEAFKNSGPGQTVIGLGEYLTRLLEAKGYQFVSLSTLRKYKNEELVNENIVIPASMK